MRSLPLTVCVAEAMLLTASPPVSSGDALRLCFFRRFFLSAGGGFTEEKVRVLVLLVFGTSSEVELSSDARRFREVVVPFLIP